MRFKKKTVLFCTVFTSLIVSNAYSDRLENDHFSDKDCGWENTDPIGPFAIAALEDIPGARAKDGGVGKNDA